METLTEIPDLGTVAGISTGVLIFVALIKRGWPNLRGRGTILIALAIGIILSVWWGTLCQAQFSVQAIARAVLAGAFGAAAAAGVALAVRSPKRK